eukprot:scaffold882_cov68-Cylindrotheca_fusiformis.AAC.2
MASSCDKLKEASLEGKPKAVRKRNKKRKDIQLQKEIRKEHKIRTPFSPFSSAINAPLSASS